MKNFLNLFLIVRIADIEFPKETSLDVYILVLQESKIRSVELLAKEGALITVSDPHEETLRLASSKYGAAVVPVDAIYDVPCDIFSPCAIGQTINANSIPRLSCSIVAGAANNQLPDSSVYRLLESKNIIYCPDFAINSGGVICVSVEVAGGGLGVPWIQKHVEGIFDTTTKVLEESKRRGRFAEEVAIELAKERIAASKSRKRP